MQYAILSSVPPPVLPSSRAAAVVPHLCQATFNEKYVFLDRYYA